MATGLEALGTASALIEIAHVGIELSKTIYQFVEAKPKLKALAEELDDGSTVLINLGNVFEQETRDRICSAEALQDANQIGSAFKRVFDELNLLIRGFFKDTNGVKVVSKFKIMGFVMKEGKINGLLGSLDRYKSSASMMLQVLMHARIIKSQEPRPSIPRPPELRPFTDNSKDIAMHDTDNNLKSPGLNTSLHQFQINTMIPNQIPEPLALHGSAPIEPLQPTSQPPIPNAGCFNHNDLAQLNEWETATRRFLLEVELAKEVIRSLGQCPTTPLKNSFSEVESMFVQMFLNSAMLSGDKAQPGSEIDTQSIPSVHIHTSSSSPGYSPISPCYSEASQGPDQVQECLDDTKPEQSIRKSDDTKHPLSGSTTPQHDAKQSRFEDQSQTSISTSTDSLATAWPLERVVSWLELNGFPKVWQDTFSHVKICATSFLSIGRSSSERRISLLYQTVYPRIKQECAACGIAYDATATRDEGMRLRRLIKKIVDETDELRNMDPGAESQVPISALARADLPVHIAGKPHYRRKLSTPVQLENVSRKSCNLSGDPRVGITRTARCDPMRQHVPEEGHDRHSLSMPMQAGRVQSESLRLAGVTSDDILRLERHHPTEDDELEDTDLVYPSDTDDHHGASVSTSLVDGPSPVWRIGTGAKHARKRVWLRKSKQKDDIFDFEIHHPSQLLARWTTLPRDVVANAAVEGSDGSSDSCA